jgi:outer membrane protein W
MSRSAVVLFVGLVCLVLAPASARADLTSEVYFGDQTPKFAFGVRATWHTIEGLHSDASSYFGGDLDFDSDYGYGFSAEYWITPSISVELAFDHVKIEDTFAAGRTVDLGLNDWAVSGKYTFMPEARLRPYVLAGIDVFTASLGLGGTGLVLTNGDVSSTWGLHVGAGAEYRFTDDFGLFAEVRYRWSDEADLEMTQWFSATPAATSAATVEYGGICATIGVKVYW